MPSLPPEEQPSLYPAPQLRNSFILILEGMYSYLFNTMAIFMDDPKCYSDIRLHPPISRQFRSSFHQAKTSMLRYISSFTFLHYGERPTSLELQNRFYEINLHFLDNEMDSLSRLSEEANLCWDYLGQLSHFNGIFSQWVRRLDVEFQFSSEHFDAEGFLQEYREHLGRVNPDQLLLIEEGITQ